MRTHGQRLGGLIALLPLACVDVHGRDPPSAVFQGDVEVVLEGCLECHTRGDTEPPLESYVDLMACDGEGRRLAEAGRLDSPVLAVLDRADHAGVLEGADRDRLAKWVGDDIPFASRLPHPRGFAAPGNADFHGDVLRSSGYAGLLADDPETSCFRCHGQTQEQGGAVPCETCHETFTEDRCDSCHGTAGDPRPRFDPCLDTREQNAAGAHGLHLDPSTSIDFPPIPCATCHEVPERVSDTGHVGDGSPSAEVRFDPALEPTASFNPETGTCTNSTCHFSVEVSWAQTASTAERCNRCHGDPPEDHASDDCGRCHVAAEHIDGTLDVGVECEDCHADLPGAHQTHLFGGRFTAGVECVDCHVVPLERDQVGHIDTDLPAELVFSGPAVSGGVDPIFDNTERCSSVGCHGGNLDGAMPLTPPWSGPDPVACGDCHGLPPVRVRGGAGVHLPTGPAICGTCHRTSEGEAITVGTTTITEAGRAVHADGCVDLGVGCPP